ncbi:X15341 cytochrome C oxidase subunit [Thelephora terrestris]|uniref:X15341 cytochrome C oxidase subunit n=1 Tax=Thelephora terrestris TaxID=56493 RepID=A0A9P6L8K0_9AGAM|nr:X15341 cytochrome C oxidase subunit [Thelephora terrestris]
MSLLTVSRRAAWRAAPRSTRSVVVEAAPKDWVTKREAVKHHAKDTTDLWRKISFYFCIPAITACYFWVEKVEAEHAQHVEHLKAENDGHIPFPPNYEYLNMRGKPFPWGMNSLFFNPHANKDVSASEE